MGLFTATVIANTVPFLPGKDFAVEEIVFSKLFTAIHGIWNRDDVLFFREKKTQKIFLEAIFDGGILEQIYQNTRTKLKRTLRDTAIEFC